MREAIAIMQWIWAASKGAYVYMPIMFDRKIWIEGHRYTPAQLIGPDQIPVPHNNVNGRNFDVADQYFSPLRFDGERSREAVGVELGVVWADLDYLPPDSGGPDPFITDHGLPLPGALWETSPGHWQAVWRLEYPIRDRSTWRAVSAKVSEVLLPAADVGGWHESKVLRVPGTPNGKRGEKGPDLEGWRHAVLRPELRLSTQDLLVNPRAHKVRDTLPPMPPLLRDDQRMKLVALEWDRIPLSARRWLTMSTEEYQNGTVVDRSQLIRSLILQLREAGLPTARVFGLIHGAPWDKFAGRPQSLWREVCRGVLV